ncbi:hypothetical protein K9E48_0012130 [Staphylococcus pseudintermedius]|nr:hypothetical protein K9E93_12175 [Staphylococcus pseudintermedius]USH24418.1 hypothetical protein K9E60_012135 [Staphylococcus pseudintermedius]USH26754.1 hypothetical protein K9E53_12120 [Staphylococcus pseudintermedius]USH29203.1 hypothetical protein K9E62_12125 [Staphylococcus pseudintermedius]USH31533.1 hypothetical protein K9E51_012170 [Staphylococcus pseudintermedius]
MKKKRNGAYQKLDNPSIEFIKKEVMDYKKVSNNLTGCVDKEIKELNGEWEGYDGNKLKLIIKNDSMNIIEYDDYSTKEEAEKKPHKAKIVKEDGKLYGIDSEGDKAVLYHVGDSLVSDGISFERVK